MFKQIKGPVTQTAFYRFMGEKQYLWYCTICMHLSGVYWKAQIIKHILV